MNNILRYEGRAALAMIGLLTGALLNIGLDPLFIFVLHMGIMGAGIATALSKCISFSILLSMFLRKKRPRVKSLFIVFRRDVTIILTSSKPAFQVWYVKV